MRVLHAYRTYFPDTQGGLEEAIRQICLNTGRHGVISRVISPSATPARTPISRPEATVYQTRLSLEVASCSMSFSAFACFRQLAEWADVIHYHFPWPFADVLHFVTRIRKPVVITYHSDIVRQRVLGALYQPLMNRFLAAADRIICTSPNYLATSDVLCRFANKVDVIPIGIDENSSVHPSDEVLSATKAKYGSDFFLFVGVLRYYKGLHILLDAIKDAHFRVVIVGSGPIELELKRQAERLGLQNVVFAGYLPDEEKLSLFRLCRAVVFPSYMRSEAFGMTLVEGSMHGKPLISTEIGSGTSHVNIDGETGLVVPAGSPTALRNAMDRLWHQPDAARQMGHKARRRYELLFTGDRMGERYYETYRKITCAETIAQS